VILELVPLLEGRKGKGGNKKRKKRKGGRILLRATSYDKPAKRGRKKKGRGERKMRKMYGVQRVIASP